MVGVQYDAVHCSDCLAHNPFHSVVCGVRAVALLASGEGGWHHAGGTGHVQYIRRHLSSGQIGSEPCRRNSTSDPHTRHGKQVAERIGVSVACAGTFSLSGGQGGLGWTNDDGHGGTRGRKRGRAWGHGGSWRGRGKKKGKSEYPDHTGWAERSDRRLSLQILLPIRKPKAQDHNTFESL